MKNITKGLLFLSIILFFSLGVIAQPPGRPPSGIGFAGNQNPVTGPVGAPIEPGTGMLVLMAIGYGALKSRNFFIKNEDKETK